MKTHPLDPQCVHVSAYYKTGYLTRFPVIDYRIRGHENHDETGAVGIDDYYEVPLCEESPEIFRDLLLEKRGTRDYWGELVRRWPEEMKGRWTHEVTYPEVKKVEAEFAGRDADHTEWSRAYMEAYKHPVRTKIHDEIPEKHREHYAECLWLLGLGDMPATVAERIEKLKAHIAETKKQRDKEKAKAERKKRLVEEFKVQRDGDVSRVKGDCGYDLYAYYTARTPDGQTYRVRYFNLVDTGFGIHNGEELPPEVREAVNYAAAKDGLSGIRL